jgi:hypothetical protein
LDLFFIFFFFLPLDPDPDSASGSGSRHPIESGSNPDPDPQPCGQVLLFQSVRVSILGRISDMPNPASQHFKSDQTRLILLGEVERLKKELAGREEAGQGLATTLKSLTEANQAWEADSRHDTLSVAEPVHFCAAPAPACQKFRLQLGPFSSYN